MSHSDQPDRSRGPLVVWLALAASTAVNLLAGAAILAKETPLRPSLDGSRPDASAHEATLDASEELTSPAGVVVVSLVQLLAQPRMYDNREVIVMGFFVRGGAHPRLFLHREDADHALMANSIALDPTDGDGGVVAGYVRAEGIFHYDEIGRSAVGRLVTSSLVGGLSAPISLDGGM